MSATPLAWSRSGRQLAVALADRSVDGSAGASQLALVTISDGSVKLLRRFDTSQPYAAAFSPDDRHVAYDFDPEQDGRKLFVAAVDGTGDHDVPGDGATDQRMLTWLTDGRLLITSDRARSTDVWALPMRDGAATGAGTRIFENVRPGFEPLGLTNDGRLFVHRDSAGRDIYLAELDAATGKAVGPATPLPGRPQAATRKEPVWSRDGALLAYVQGAPGAPDSVIVRTMSTGATRTYAMPIWNPDHMLWHPGDRALSIEGFDDHNISRTFRLDLETGETTVWRDALVWALSPDGRYSYEGLPARLGIARRRLADNSVDMLTTEGAWGPRLSPDGRWLAYFTTARLQGSLAIVSTAGGSPRVLVKDFRFGYARLAWTPDSRHIIYQSPPVGVHRVSIDGGPPEPLGIATGGGRSGNLTELSLNADGRRLVLDLGRRSREVWVWENLVPRAK